MRNVAMQPTDFATLSDDALHTRLDEYRREVVAGTRDGRFDFEYLELEREASIRQWVKNGMADPSFLKVCDDVDAEIARISAMPVPSLKDTRDTDRNDPWFSAMMRVLENESDRREDSDEPPMWMHSVPPIVVTRHGKHFQSTVLTSEPKLLKNETSKFMSYEEYVAYVPCLRRKGFKVSLCVGNDTEYDDVDMECKLTLYFTNRRTDPHSRLVWDKKRLFYGWLTGCGDQAILCETITLHPTDPRSVRFRGLLKCLPRLLCMLHGVPGKYQGARARVNDPVHLRKRADAIERRDLADAMDTDTNENPAYAAADVRAAEAEAAQAWERKRQLIDALHCNAAEEGLGARWACLRLKDKDRDPGPISLPYDVGPEQVAVRIEQVAGDHFVFQQPPPFRYYNNWAVMVLHRDAFEVVDWDEHRYGHKRDREAKFAHRFKKEAK